MTTNSQTSTLYDQDYYLWIETTVKHIRDQHFEQVDWENLLEELESLGRSDKRELRNRLTVVLEHLLKLVYWESERETNARGWKGTITEQRKQIKLLIKDSPSLKPFLIEVFAECYSDAIEITSAKTGIAIDTFPATSLFILEETLDPEYLPN